MASKLKFLIDVGVGKKVEKWLAAKGYDVKFVRDINPKADDSEISDKLYGKFCVFQGERLRIKS